MKRLLWGIFLLFNYSLKAQGIELSFNSTSALPNQNISVTYHGTSQDSLEFFIYRQEHDKECYLERKFVGNCKEGQKFEISTNAATRFLFIRVVRNEKFIDDPKNNFIQFIDNQNITAESKAFIAKYKSPNFAWQLKLDGNGNESKKLFEEAFKIHPDLKRKFYLTYLYTFDIADSFQKMQLEDELNEFSSLGDLDANETWNLCTFYQKLGLAEMAENYRTKAILTFPEDKITINQVFFKDYFRPFMKLKTSQERIKLYEAYKSKYKGIKHENLDALELHVSLLLSVLLPDYLETNTYQAWQQEMDLLKEERRYACFASTAAKLVQEKKHLEIARKITEKSLEGEASLLKRARDWHEPLTLADFEIQETRKSTLAGRYRTYGQILALYEEKAKAKEYLRKAAFDYGFLKYDDINEAYISFLKEIGETELAEKERSLMKIAQNRLDEKNLGFQFIEIKLLKKKLPELELSDSTGKIIDLKQLNSKVIVVDFWASWCGPCFLKFKPMQNLINYYGNNKDIAFLFVNSKERSDFSQKEILNSIISKGYNFNVLFDEKNKLESALKIQNIPTILVIDENRNIRFIEIGFDPQKGVNEIYSAIEKLIY